MEAIFEVDMRKRQGPQIGLTGLEGLGQEIRMLLATRRGSVPLDRDYGISWDAVDMPMPEAITFMISEIAGQLEKYVPRVRLRDVAFKSADPVDGILQPTVTVEIRSEYLSDFS